MTASLRIQGIGYVPGRASGLITRGPTPTGRGIALIREDEIPALDAAGPLPAGLVVIDGAPFSHRCITLLGLGCPAVLIGSEEAGTLRPGLLVRIDGAGGLIRIGNPERTEVPAPRPSTPPAGRPVPSRDGSPVALRASVRSPIAAARAVAAGASGIGLVRSEFLLPAGGGIPDERFYHRTLTALCIASAGLPVNIRLLDLAPDKLPAWLPPAAAMTSTLGLQGARLFDVEPVASVVRAQLAAIAGLRQRQWLGVTIPYLTQRGELRLWLTEVRRMLGPPIAVGAMAETPAAVLDIGRWLADADFVAIGCNDLMQGLFAADRDQPALRRYLDPYDPVLHRLLAQAAAAAGNRVDQVQLCGLLPQVQGVLPVLLGLGFRAVSVDAGQIPYLAAAVRATSIPEATTLAEAVCAADDAAEVRRLLGVPAP